MTNGSTHRWTPDALDELSAIVPLAPATVADASDFGHLVTSAPAAIARPRDAAQVARAVAFANDRGLRVGACGKRFSQGGQSLTRGVALDLSAMARVDDVDVPARTVKCDAGTTWRSVVEKAARFGLVPRVLPLNLDLTVGGTLSVGGVGSTSHRYGPAVANVVAIDAVDGTGKQHSARVGALPAPEPTNGARALRDAALGGLGRAVVMTRTTLALREMLPRVRTFYLLYDDAAAWLADQARLAPTCDHLEAFCSASVQGLRSTPQGRRPFAKWFYGLHVSYEHDCDPPTEAAVLSGLAHRWHTHTEDGESLAFTQRYEPRFAMMRATDTWSAPHPWLEAFLPVDRLAALLPDLLDRLPLSLGDGHRVMHVAQHHLPTYFMTPDRSEAEGETRPDRSEAEGETRPDRSEVTPNRSEAEGETRPEAPRVAAFAVLPVGVAPALVEGTLRALEGVHETLVNAGGKRYLSGWLGPCGADERFERAHFGARYDALCALRRRYDPRGTFSPDANASEVHA